MNKKSRKIISIITPCFNAEKYIEETVNSVIRNTVVQNDSVDLEYIICDGGSTDKTIEIIERIFLSINQKNITTKILSEKDGGMYEALSKGLGMITGEICAYINAGDFYSPTAFDIVLEIFSNDDIKWVTGLQITYNENSHLVNAKLPFKFRNSLLECGVYGKFLPFIQQESTFWHANLNALLDFKKLGQYRLAGDFYMWEAFSKKENIYIVEAWLGGFKIHQNQLSENIKAYRLEMNKTARKMKWNDFIVYALDKIIWNSPNRIKKIFNAKFLLIFNHKQQCYR